MSQPDNPYLASQPTPTLHGPRNRLMPAAIGLLVTSILHVVFGLFYFVYAFSVLNSPNAPAAGGHALLVYCMYYGITMLYCLLLISGAFSMMRRGSYLWAVTTCILAMVPLLGPCYFLALPFGIWGVLVLRQQGVRDSFTHA